MEQNLLNKFRTMISKEGGVALSGDKAFFLKNKIKKRMQTLALSDPKEYLEIVKTDLTGNELRELLESLSTNHTYFWREYQHFSFYEDLLNKFDEARKDKIRIWCAGTATGEEGHTLAMIIREVWGDLIPDIKVLATDICPRVLAFAVQGIYGNKDIQNLPKHLKANYLEKLIIKEEKHWRIVECIRELIVYKQVDLLSQMNSVKGPIDVIFCRNVMIYFNKAQRQRCLEQFQDILGSDGYLFIGLTENLVGLKHHLKEIGVGIYQKR